MSVKGEKRGLEIFKCLEKKYGRSEKEGKRKWTESRGRLKRGARDVLRG